MTTMTKQKTPLTELIEAVEEMRKQSDPIFGIALLSVKQLAQSLLPKERELLRNAYLANMGEVNKWMIEDEERYYTQTFEQP